jgi:hypothetical protein
LTIGFFLPKEKKRKGIVAKKLISKKLFKPGVSLIELEGYIKINLRIFSAI